MKRRITSIVGLGSGAKDLLTNNGGLNEKFAIDVTNEYFEEFDYQVDRDQIMVGIEPTYQDDLLKIVAINRNIGLSSITRGKAWGPYGTQIGKTSRFYKNYKKKSKFINFVDRWHPVLFPVN